MATTCKRCGAVLASRTGVGRPAMYCSTDCRVRAWQDRRRRDRAEEARRWFSLDDPAEATTLVIDELNGGHQ